MTVLRVVRLLATVVIAAGLAFVAEARLSLAAVQRDRDCVEDAYDEVQRRYQLNVYVVAMRQCGIEDPTPELPVGEPVPRVP